MSDRFRMSALHGHLDGALGGGPVRSGGPGIVLAERRLAAIFQLNGAPAEAELGNRLGKLEAAPLRACGGPDLALLWNGPGMWLAVSETQSAGALKPTLETALGGTDATVTDLSQGRSVFDVEGPEVKNLLAKGCPLDVDAMRAGDTTPTLLGHFNVQLHCVAEEHFRVFVFRSFGLALWEWLSEEALEYGYALVPPGAAPNQS